MQLMSEQPRKSSNQNANSSIVAMSAVQRRERIRSSCEESGTLLSIIALSGHRVTSRDELLEVAVRRRALAVAEVLTTKALATKALVWVVLGTVEQAVGLVTLRSWGADGVTHVATSWS